MGDFLGLIIFIIFIIARTLAQQKQNSRPKRGQPPKSAPKPVETHKGSPIEQKKGAETEEDWFPVPDDIKELFGFPSEEKQTKPKPEPVPVEKKYETSQEKPHIPNNLDKGGLAQAGEIGSADLTEGTQPVATATSVKRREQTTIGGGIQLNPSAVAQGIIWSEILQPPKSRRRHLNMRR